MLIIACEAFFESYPQIVLALYTISFKDTKLSTMQSLCLVGSIFLVSYAIISFDIMGGDVELNGFQDYVKYLLKVLPLYCLGTFFRVASLSLTVIYLRWWAIIPTLILLGEMIIIVGTCIKWDLDIIYHMALTNLNAANIGMIRIKHIHEESTCEGDKEKYDVSWDEKIESKCTLFLKVSQYVTYVHHFVVLSTILYMLRTVDNFNWLGSSSTIEHMDELFHPDYTVMGVRSVYILFCTIFMIGAIDVLVTSCMSRNVKFAKKTRRKSTKLEIEEIK